METAVQVYGGHGRNECEPIVLKLQDGSFKPAEKSDERNSVMVDLWFTGDGATIAKRLTQLMNDRYFIESLTLDAGRMYHKKYDRVRLRSVIPRSCSDRCVFIRFTWGEE